MDKFKKITLILFALCLSVLSSCSGNLDKKHFLGGISYDVSSEWNYLSEPSGARYYDAEGFSLFVQCAQYEQETVVFDYMDDYMQNCTKKFPEGLEVKHTQNLTIIENDAAMLQYNSVSSGKIKEHICYAFIFGSAAYVLEFQKTEKISEDNQKNITALISSIEKRGAQDH